ncbi:cell division and transport-associated protein TolR [Desulfobotulus alkaliphilus]|uniref:Cell division and transport-associated protein TolR n=1 Tax=Desulfobotulus alkaliphilus TaxID=622671 RepID=A0A562RRQ7_9BACT|nr:ExbD/TolR family protein [Desulfobotulus alkaliphilus]TWI71785.1 cell division and transport-associated protein TolR [Desulfobotulus alkaliphilus]
MAGGLKNGEMMSDINVTPFVDVMLVLLIMFMVTAPMMQQGEEVNLPQVDSAALEGADDPLILVVDRDGVVWIQDVRIAPGFLENRMADLLRGDPDAQVLLKADAGVPYGRVVEVMNGVRKAGVTRLGMLTQPLGDKAE